MPATFDACTLDAARVAALDDEVIDWRYKSVPESVVGQHLGQIAEGGLNLFRDWPMPALTLLERPLASNVAAMADWCRQQGVLLAPHGKTTMAPQIFARQVAAGCFALTCATPWHLRVYRHFGVSRILYANELVEASALAFVASELRRDPGFTLLCLVDSTAAVEALTRGLAGSPRPVDVLIEIGLDGARTGCRTLEQALIVANAAAAAPQLRVAGVECFEGLAQATGNGSTMEAVDGFLERAAQAFVEIDAAGLMQTEPIVTAGGSAWFDRVVATFAPLPATTVLRSGCYVTQDGGFYDDTSPLGARAAGEATLRNALEIWGAVLSRPEPTLCVASFGRRDVPFDQGLPTPVAAVRAGARRPLDGCAVIALSDQHAHIRIPADVDLRPGDLVGATISHPCGAFDRWRLIPVVDDAANVVDAVLSVF